MTKEERAPSRYKGRRRRPRDLSWAWTGILLISIIIIGLYFFYPGILNTMLEPFGLAGKSPRIPDDPDGKRYLSIQGTKHSFLANQIEGDILVLTGLVKNYYASDRSRFQVRGELFDEQGRVLASKSIYCGRWLNREALAGLSCLEIQKAIEADEERDPSHAGPGRSVPYMMVFNNIPENLSGYSVEAVGSEQVD